MNNTAIIQTHSKPLTESKFQELLDEIPDDETEYPEYDDVPPAI